MEINFGGVVMLITIFIAGMAAGARLQLWALKRHIKKDKQ